MRLPMLVGLGFGISVGALAITPTVLAQEKITGSAAFQIDDNNVVRGVTVGVSVGKNDSFSEAFYDPNTGQLSTVSIGSAGSITLGEQTSVGIGSIQDSLDPNPGGQTTPAPGSGNITIGPESGTDSLELP